MYHHAQHYMLLECQFFFNEPFILYFLKGVSNAEFRRVSHNYIPSYSFLFFIFSLTFCLSQDLAWNGLYFKTFEKSEGWVCLVLFHQSISLRMSTP
jgi:hypothetical protein